MDVSSHRSERGRLESGRAVLVALMSFALAVPATSATADDYADCPNAAALDALLTVIRKQFDGRILTLALKNDDGSCVYSIKWLTSAGQVRKLRYDAENLKLLKATGRHLEEHD